MTSSRWTGIACLGITAFGWGLNWPFMKLLLRELPPLSARGLAGVVAAVILAAVAVARGERLAVPLAAIPRLLFATFTNVIAWMGFGTIAMQWVTVSEGALLAYTMPIWATLLAWPLLGTRPTLRDLVALCLGLGGIVTLFGGTGFALGPEKLAGGHSVRLRQCREWQADADSATCAGGLAGRVRLSGDAGLWPRR